MSQSNIVVKRFSENPEKKFSRFGIDLSRICGHWNFWRIVKLNDTVDREVFSVILIFEIIEFIVSAKTSDCAIRFPSETDLLSSKQRLAGRAIMTP